MILNNSVFRQNLSFIRFLQTEVRFENEKTDKYVKVQKNCRPLNFEDDIQDYLNKI